MMTKSLTTLRTLAQAQPYHYLLYNYFYTHIAVICYSSARVMSTSSKRSQPTSDSEPSSKKVRFDARNPSNIAADEPDEDEEAILEIDTIGKSSNVKHSAVNLDGFESDSDDDNFNVRAAERAKAKKKAEKG